MIIPHMEDMSRMILLLQGASRVPAAYYIRVSVSMFIDTRPPFPGIAEYSEAAHHVQSIG